MHKFQNNSVKDVFDSWDTSKRKFGLELRELIFTAANALPQTGTIEETLKWGQPSYLTPETRSGSTLRIGLIKNSELLGLFFHCQTTLIETFRSHYSDQLKFEGNRAIVLNPQNPLPTKPLKHCIGLALTYHLKE